LLSSSARPRISVLASADTAGAAAAGVALHLQIAWVLELSERRRPPARRGTFSSPPGDGRVSFALCRIIARVTRRLVRGCSGARELDDDVLLRLHPVPGEPGEVARLAAVVSGRRRRRRRGRRRSRPVVTPGTSPRSWHPAPFTLLAAFLTELKKKTL